jgi:hypothetical protein
MERIYALAKTSLLATKPGNRSHDAENNRCNDESPSKASALRRPLTVRMTLR